MKAILLIVDNRKAYRERLLAALELRESNYECLALNDIRQVDDLSQDKFNRVALILSADYFSSDLSKIFPETLRLELSDKAPDQYSADLLKTMPDRAQGLSAEQIHLQTPQILQDGHGLLSRQAQAGYICQIISALMTRPLAADNETRADEKNERDTSPNYETNEQQSGHHSLGCLLYFSRAERSRAITTILNSGKKKAYDMIYLPIMPLYDMTFPFRTGSKDSLGSLLLTLKSGRTPTHDELGNYLYLHNDGYYTFLCPERADDLICADNRSLRELLLLLKQFLETRAAPTHSLLDVSGMSLERHAMLAALCDYAVIETPSRKSDAALMAQQELAIFLSKLPTSCAIYEDTHIEKLKGGAAWFC